MNSSLIPIARSENLVVQELNNNETLVYDLKNNKALCLNKSTALVWKHCVGKKTVSDISKELSKKLDSKITEDFVWLAIKQLKKNNLLDSDINIPIDIKELSRRQIIKRIGVTSVIALPIISAVVAPNSIHAQSCVPPTTPVGPPAGVPNTGATACDPFDSLCCNGDAGVTFTVGPTAFCGCSPAP